MENNILKCLYCKKKINSLIKQLFTCKCGDIYCREHLIGYHNCKYDYKKEYENILKQKLPIIVGEKITKI